MNVPKITNDIDKVQSILRFRKLKLMETVMLIEEISQLRAELSALRPSELTNDLHRP